MFSVIAGGAFEPTIKGGAFEPTRKGGVASSSGVISRKLSPSVAVKPKSDQILESAKNLMTVSIKLPWNGATGEFLTESP